MQELIGFGVFIAAAIFLSLLSISLEALWHRNLRDEEESKVKTASASKILERLVKYDARFLIYAIYFVLLLVAVPLLIPYILTKIGIGTPAFSMLILILFVVLMIILYIVRKNMLKWR